MDETFEFLKNSNEFALDMYKATTCLNPANSVHISPFAAQSCAALVLMGTTGDTALQLSSMLQMEHLSKDKIANSYASLISYLPVSLTGFKVASKIFQSKRQNLKSEFLEVAANKFFTEVQKVNFENNVKCAAKINKWIEATLPIKTPGMVDPYAIIPDTAVLLVSVVYFQGNWLHPFNLSLTSKQPFWVTPAESIETNTMTTTERFLCAESEELDAKAIELYFSGSEVSMVLLLPNKQNTLEILESNLDQVNLKDLMDRMSEQFVTLILPRFKLETCNKLHSNYLKMAPDSRMFTAGAELGAMLEGDEPTHHHLEILQRTVIEVNEKGADTCVPAGLTLARKNSIRFQTPPPEFKVNHPFLYVLKGGANTILSIGCVRNGKFI